MYDVYVELGYLREMLKCKDQYIQHLELVNKQQQDFIDEILKKNDEYVMEIMKRDLEEINGK